EDAQVNVHVHLFAHVGVSSYLRTSSPLAAFCYLPGAGANWRTARLPQVVVHALGHEGHTQLRQVFFAEGATRDTQVTGDLGGRLGPQHLGGQPQFRRQGVERRIHVELEVGTLLDGVRVFAGAPVLIVLADG